MAGAVVNNQVQGQHYEVVGHKEGRAEESVYSTAQPRRRDGRFTRKPSNDLPGNKHKHLVSKDERQVLSQKPMTAHPEPPTVIRQNERSNDGLVENRKPAKGSKMSRRK